MKKAIMTMGLPGSGKSTVLHNEYNVSEYTMIDPDEIKKSNPDYDPKAPELVHDWSQAEANRVLNEAIRDSKNIIIDGTGTNSEKMVKRINELHSFGYSVEVLYVKVNIKTSLERNRKRERSVPEAVIYEKAGLISTSFEIVSSYADSVKIINND